MPNKDKNKEKIVKRNWYLKNKEKILKLKKIKYLENRDKIKEKSLNYYKLNRNKILKQQYKYVCKNREIRNLAAKKRYYEKMKDPSFRIIQAIRARTRGVLKGVDKSKRSFEYLGIPSVEFFWNHLEKQFKQGMTRENYGLWEVDHIKAISTFNIKDLKQIKICFNYKNCQPMWSLDNKIKGNK
jgi:hypothetical protein